MAIQKLFKKHLGFISLLFIFAVTLLIFYSSLNLYFLQDDWFALNKLNITDLQKFIFLKQEVIYWRPIGMQGFFWLTNNLFYLNPFPLHIIIFSIHLLNGVLIYVLLKQFINNKKANILATFIYLTASFHLMSRSWLSLSWVTIGTLFFLIGTNIFINAKNVISLLIAYILFLFSIASTEFAIAFTPLILVLTLIHRPNSLTKIKKIFLLITLMTTIVYGLFRVLNQNVQSDYQLQIGIETIKNVFWYFLWFFNIPEQVREQLILSKLQFTDVIIRDAGRYLFPIMILPMLTIVMFLYMLFSKRLNLIYYSYVLLFIIFLFPVLLLKNHSFAYYLTIPAIPLILFLSLLISKIQYKKLMISLFALLWLLSSIANISFSNKYHWVTGESAISKKIIAKVVQITGKPNDNVIIAFLNSQLIHDQSLMGQNAMQVLFEDKNIKTVYINKPSDLEKIRYKKVLFIDLRDI